MVAHAIYSTNELENIVEVNDSLFGILITDNSGETILAQNKATKKMGIGQKNWYIKRPDANSFDNVILYDEGNRSSQIAARIYYFRSIKSGFWPKFKSWFPLRQMKYRDWNFCFMILGFIFFLVWVSLELFISNRHKTENLLNQKLASYEKEYKLLINSFEHLKRNCGKAISNTENINRDMERQFTAASNSFERFVSENLKRYAKSFIVIKNRYTTKKGEIDHLLFAKNRAVAFIIEDKCYPGEIIGDINSQWYATRYDSIIKSIGDNPYYQLRDYVFWIKDYIQKKVRHRPLIIGIILFPNEANLDRLNLENCPDWFHITKLSDLTKIFQKEITSQKYKFSAIEQGVLRRTFSPLIAEQIMQSQDSA